VAIVAGSRRRIAADRSDPVTGTTAACPDARIELEIAVAGSGSEPIVISTTTRAVDSRRGRRGARSERVMAFLIGVDLLVPAAGRREPSSHDGLDRPGEARSP
jgi:hypothetical protein